jgi:hypothetical protein
MHAMQNRLLGEMSGSQELKDLISRCQTCKQKQKRCTALRERPNIHRGRTALYLRGSWDHLAVKLHVKFKSPEMVPDDTGDESEGSSLLPAAGKEGVKGKGKEKMTDLLSSQIDKGYLVYNPKMPNKKIGLIKVGSQKPGEISISLGICRWFK